MTASVSGRGGTSNAGTRRVYVSQGGDGLFHADVLCTRLGRQRSAGVSWCPAREAHRSCLRACPICGRELARALALELGSIPSGSKAGLSMPKLSPLEPSQISGVTGTDGCSSESLPYGVPAGLDDPRFHHQSILDWGTASFGQDPEEFLGSTTDDDHEWRSGRRFLD